MLQRTKRTPTRYKSYNFIDKDPIIDKLRTLVQRSGLSYREISNLSGVTVQTLYNWFQGDVKRPQHAGVMAVVHALGYRMSIVKGGRR
jgi:transcriptional regulator with XRE-family HTH domain